MSDTTLEDLQAKLDKALASIEKLETKNSELIDREKTAKTKAEEADTAREEAQQEAASKSGDIEAVKTSMQRKYDTDMKKANDKIAERDARLGELLIDNEIKTAITTYNILPHMVEAYEAIMHRGTKLEGTEALRNGIPLGESIAEWSKSANAMHYMEAPANSGGGAQGSSAKSDKWAKPPELSEMTEWINYAVNNVEVASAKATAWGRPDLTP